MEFNKFIDELKQESLTDQLEWLYLVGMEAYERASTNRQFLDQTGKLMSSIGYAVVYNGRIWREGGFNLVRGGIDGQKKGRQLILESMSDKGIELIFVAGEHYATFVEARGYDVNTAGELIIDKLMSEWVAD